MTKLVPVILAGGMGARLWPLSTPERPKPFISLNGGRSLLEETLARVSDAEFFTQPLIIANRNHLPALEACLGNRDMDVMLEPCARNTAPALAAACLHVLETHGDVPMLVLPSDHTMTRADIFAASLPQAAELTEDYIVTFGIPPIRPDTQYGYIRRGNDLSQGAYKVSAFREKPDLSTAKYFLAEGGHDWNSGMFVFRPSIMLEEFRKHEPALLVAARLAYEQGRRDGSVTLLDEQAFQRITPVSIDHAVMERTRKAAVIPIDCGWSDIGHWDAMWEAVNKDANGNATSGDCTLHASRECYVKQDGGPSITIANVEGLVIVSTRDAVLITKRGQVVHEQKHGRFIESL